MQESEMLKAQIEKENEEIGKQLQEIGRALEVVEKQFRKNNIAVTGLIMSLYDSIILKEMISNLLKEQLKIDVTVKRVTKTWDKTRIMKIQTEA